MRVSIAFSYSAAVVTMLRERVTPTLIGSKARPQASTSALNRTISSPIFSKESNWPSSRLWPSAATFLLDVGLPAPIHNGGWGFWAVGGSTATSSNCQYVPRYDHGVSEVQALVITSKHSSKRASASSMGTQNPANSLYRYPLPMPKSTRPPDNKSRVATCSASSTGLCQGSTSTAVPRRNVVVRAPIQVNKFKLADTWPKPVKWCSTRNVLT